MDHRSVTPAPPQVPPVKARTAWASQVLWHACRTDSPAVTVILASAPSGQYALEVAFGAVALQRIPFSTDLAAVERAERLLTELEARGYQRQRQDRRLRPRLLNAAPPPDR
jgi:hypothetical protein